MAIISASHRHPILISSAPRSAPFREKRKSRNPRVTYNAPCTSISSACRSLPLPLQARLFDQRPCVTRISPLVPVCPVRLAAIAGVSRAPVTSVARSAISGTRRGALATTVVRATDGDVATGSSGSGESTTSSFDIRRVEEYTERVKGEVVVIDAVVDGEEDQVVVFRGFSSSLVRATPSDPSDPVLPADAGITAVGRVKGPFNPARMDFIQEGMTWEEFEQLLLAMGL